MARNSWIKTIYILPLLLIALAFYMYLNGNIFPTLSCPDSYIKIGDKQALCVMIADEAEEQIRGLSGRRVLDKNSGMLFVFAGKQIRDFWMKDMLIPLDIIWISENKIVKIDKNLQPEGSQPKLRYNSVEPVDNVLEVNAGFAEENNLTVGDKIEINIIQQVNGI